MPDGKRRRLHKLEPEGRRALLELLQQTILPNRVLEGMQHACGKDLESFKARVLALTLPRFKEAVRSRNSSASLLARAKRMSVVRTLALRKGDLIKADHSGKLSCQLFEQGVEQLLREHPECEKLWKSFSRGGKDCAADLKRE